MDDLTYFNGEWTLYIDRIAKALGIEGPTPAFFQALSEDKLKAEVLESMAKEYGSAQPLNSVGFPDGDVRRYLNVISRSDFWDYTDKESVLARDREEMAELQGNEPPPDIFLEYESTHYMPLPHPACIPPYNILSKAAYILFYTFGCLEQVGFHDHSAMFKCVPSLGARHPFEVYIHDYYDVLGLGRGCFHYSVKHHALGCIGSANAFGEEWSYPLVFEIRALIDRYQWRYRNSYHYSEIYLEIGHIVANLKILCESLDLTFSEFPIVVDENLKSPLFCKYLLQGF